jgi:hypothetical protein
MRLLSEVSSSVHPGIPSVILTANRIDQFLSNTGSFSGDFNGSFTGSLQGTASYADTATTSSYALNSTSASYSLVATSASYALNSTSASYSLVATSASYALNATTSSYALFATSASQASNANTATSASYSLVATSASYALNSTSASYALNATTAASATSASFANNTTSASFASNIANGLNITASNISVTGNETILGNLTVNGTASFGYTQTTTGSAIIIGDEFIILNADTPTLPFAGVKVYDTGSNTTASFEWNGNNDYWIAVEETGNSAAFLTGVTGSKGAEAFPAQNSILKGTGNNQVVVSNISDNGTTVLINSNTGITGSIVASALYSGTQIPSPVIEVFGTLNTKGGNYISIANTNPFSTGSMTLSGSGNIVLGGTGVSNDGVIAGRLYAVNGTGNIFNSFSNCYISGSNSTLRAPTITNSHVSALTLTDNRPSINTVPFTISNCYIPISTTTTISTGSLSIFNSTLIGAGFNVTGSNSIVYDASQNILIGQTNLITLDTNVSAASSSFNNNIVIGTTNLVTLTGSLNPTMNSSALIGYNLVATGSNFATSSFGSTILGRWNAQDGTDILTNTVFAIGTGTGPNTRRTSFHVSSSGLTTISDGLITGSLIGTASFAISASNAISSTSASYALNSTSASYAFNSTTSSYTLNSTTSSYALEALSSSYALTASFAMNGGGGGSSAGAKTFTQLTPATTWSFTHNLNTLLPLVEVYDSNYNVIIPTNITNSGSAITNIYFENSRSGYAVISTGGSLAITGSNAQLIQTLAATTWSFHHGLNTTYPVFTIFDEYNDVIIPERINVQNANTASIYFSIAKTGVAVAANCGLSGSLLFESASYATSASYSLNTTSASYATTASFVGYNHIQTSSSNVWNITHNLNNKYPMVQVYNSDSTVIMPMSISGSDVNTTIITFSFNTTGYVRII